MSKADPQAQALLDRWAAATGIPVERLSPAQVRRDDLAVLELQNPPVSLHAVEDLAVPGPPLVR